MSTSTPTGQEPVPTTATAPETTPAPVSLDVLEFLAPGTSCHLDGTCD